MGHFVKKKKKMNLNCGFLDLTLALFLTLVTGIWYIMLSQDVLLEKPNHGIPF